MHDQEQSTVEQDPLTPGTETKAHDFSYYFGFSQKLYQDPDNKRRTKGLFGRIGNTHSDVNIIASHYSLGLTLEGMIAARPKEISRPKDILGIVGWYNESSSELSNTLEDSSEGMEACYRFQVTNWLQVSPDVQILLDSGIERDTDDTVVLGLRALIHIGVDG